MRRVGKTTAIVMLLLGSTWGCNQDEGVVLPREEMKIQPQTEEIHKFIQALDMTLEQVLFKEIREDK